MINTNLISINDCCLENKASIMKGHSGHVTSFAILHNKRIVSGSYDRTIKVWNSQTRNCDIIFKDICGISYISVINNEQMEYLGLCR